jgi:hypothetical protein
VDYSYAHACTTACESPLTTFATISNRSHPFLCNNEKGPQSGPFIVGRGGGIRTPGTFRFNGFQDRRDRPLCHSSVFLRKFVNFGLQMYGILRFSQTGTEDFRGSCRWALTTLSLPPLHHGAKCTCLPLAKSRNWGVSCEQIKKNR